MAIPDDHPALLLDDVMPLYRHQEVHAITIDASREAVWRAIQEVTPGDLPLTRALMAVRSLPARGRLRRRPDAGRTIAAGLGDRWFGVIADDPPNGTVLGTVGRPWDLRRGRLRPPRDGDLAAETGPDQVRVAMNFCITGGPDRVVLRTETRIEPTDERAARAFRRYWRVVRPGSGIVRREMLRAVRRRAEAAPA